MIDRDHLAQQTGLDADLQRDVLILFVAQLEDLRRELEAHPPTRPDGGQDRCIATLLHRSRGAAAAVGARELAAALATAEQEAGHDASRTAWHELATALHGTVREARDLIAALPPRGLAKGNESY